MENPSDDCNNGAVAIDEINVIPGINKYMHQKSK